ncbi:MAG TPA: hypothetical protein VHI51_06815 [Ktedonobacterales bacterium]|nr:hypothetical protein [Ktedonobacterales bacterium]
MAKKSHTGHRPLPQQAKGAARKPQTPGGATSSATLVRAPGAQPASAPETPSASNVVADTAAPTAATTSSRAATASRPATASGERQAAVVERPAAPKPTPAKPAAAKPAAAKPVASTARPQANTTTREQNQRLARARATQRARQANLISAEHYSYVLGDLKLIVALAVSALVVLIALTFVLPH